MALTVPYSIKVNCWHTTVYVTTIICINHIMAQKLNSRIKIHITLEGKVQSKIKSVFNGVLIHVVALCK